MITLGDQEYKLETVINFNPLQEILTFLSKLGLNNQTQINNAFIQIDNHQNDINNLNTLSDSSHTLSECVTIITHLFSS